MYNLTLIEDDKTMNAANIPTWAVEKIKRDLEFKIGCDIARDGKVALAKRDGQYVLIDIKGVKPL